ncbi:MAG TPA: 16S rRNA (uracil(1498)-N(3))-methyltransferase [Thermoanaerobaculia bacterium]|nr:16S rRNA (uracil(1498)-N(3))-methyltransferase [Thermoanaerobaculia bacterium]
MNLILLFPEDFADPERAVLTGRRLRHVAEVHRAGVGDELTVGVANGRIGRGLVTRLDAAALELRVTLDRDPPPPLAITLVLALPRPKVVNRVIAGATSMGVGRLFLINAWRVEKSYWKSPRLSEENLLAQCIVGLEQARDTRLPSIEVRRLFRPFVEEELPRIIAGSRALLAHPAASAPLPHSVPGPVTLVIGPEGGFIDAELASLTAIGFEPVTLGERVLRTETAVAAAVAIIGARPPAPLAPRSDRGG